MMNWNRIFTVLLCVTAFSVPGCLDDDDIGVDEFNNDIINNDDFNNDFIINNDFVNNDDFDDSEDFLGDPVGNPPTLDQFEQQLTFVTTQSFCQSAFLCPEMQSWFSIVSVASRFGDLETCVGNFNPSINAGLLDTHRVLIGNGTLVYDEAQATACLNEMFDETVSCGDFTTSVTADGNSACDQVFVAQLETGDECVHDLECTSQNCITDDDLCGGICGAPFEVALENESCTAATCDEGLICVFEGRDDINGLICVQPRTLQRGEFCFGFSERCADSLVCGLDDSCTDPPTFVGNGETCNQVDTFCNPGLACHGIDPDNATSTSTCGPLRELGETCQTSHQCLFDLYCNTFEPNAGTCQTQKQLSDTCTGFDADECTTGLFCNMASDPPVCDTLITGDFCISPSNNPRKHPQPTSTHHASHDPTHLIILANTTPVNSFTKSIWIDAPSHAR